jgi:predicted nucleic acid-binding protein
LAVIHMRFPDVQSVSKTTHAKAVIIARDHNIGFYDALIIAAALEAGCDTLFIEDLQHGCHFEKLQMVNPFQ